MNFTLLAPIFNTLIERLFPDKEKAAQAQIELQKVLNEAQARQDEAEANKMASQKEVIVAEVNSSSWAAKNWRPFLMLACVGILVNNWLLIPLLTAFGLPIVATPIPTELWTLVTIGLGGYIGKETISNYSENKYRFDDKAFFAKLRQHGLIKSQAEVDLYNAALKEGKSNES